MYIHIYIYHTQLCIYIYIYIYIYTQLLGHEGAAHVARGAGHVVAVVAALVLESGT